MGILYGVLTAISWGCSDFIARFATKRAGALRCMLYMQGFGFLLLTLLLFLFHTWGHLFDGSGTQPWMWGILAGVVNTAASLSLFKAFEIGKLSVVAPISASAPALTTVLSYFSGEKLTLFRIAGIITILLGVVLVAGGEKSASTDDLESQQRSGKGLGWAFGSAVTFGILFWILGVHAVPQTGSLATVWLIRLMGATITLAILLLWRLPVRLPQGEGIATARWQMVGMGILDTSAYVLNNRGLQVEQVSVVTVLASLYGAVTVALAALFLHEKIAVLQWTGIAGIFAGIFLISR
jgi:drug/metabolite transporter (DMT)-like permease